MSENAAGERTESATGKRRKEARQRGQVARSMEVNSVAVLLAGMLMLLSSLAWMGHGMRRLGIYFFDGIDAIPMETPTHATNLVRLLYSEVSTLVAPILLTVMVVGTGIAFAQVGWSFSLEALQWRWEKLNPIEGSKKFVNKRALFDVAKNVLKVAILCTVAWLVIEDRLPQILGLVAVPDGFSQIRQLTLELLIRLMAVLTILAIIDFAWQKRRHEDSIKMTKTEVKQEAKDAEGDPQLKARIRSIQLEHARQRMMEDVKSADVVITNPTHFAVALKYSAEEPAPRVVAKGQGFLALRIRETAAAAGVPRVENPPLARALYRTTKVGSLIPTKLYESVAKVLAAVFRTGTRRAEA